MKPATIGRFAAKVHVQYGRDGCWLWAGAMRNEYGCLSVDGKTVYAHRFAYEVYVGPIPQGYVILHACDNRQCVNPWHLRVGTQQANVHDAICKDRLKCFQQVYSFTPASADVESIRRDAKLGLSHRRLADKYQMATTSIRRVLGVVK